MEQYAVLIAIDWADQKHDICLYDQTTGKREQTIIKHTPAALQEWALGLRQANGFQKRRTVIEDHFAVGF
jgi:hypothetical protein